MTTRAAPHAMTAGSEPDPKPSASTIALREDLHALQGSGKGKFLALIGLGVVALVGAIWAFWPGGGIGNADSPGKVLVVTESASREPFLQKMGFDADAQTFDNLEAKARAELDGLDDVDGTAAIVTFADQFGFGYVVFERPQQFDFKSLELESTPSFGDDDRYAVVSGGDLAKPAKMTAGARILDALFEQEELKALVPPNEPTDVDAVELRDKLREAVDAVSSGPKLETIPKRL